MATDLPKAEHKGFLEFPHAKIPCFVLDDGRRVVSGRGLTTAIGMKGRGQGTARISNHPTLKNYIPDGLSVAIETPIEFSGPGGRKTTGFEATVLHDICEAILTAYDVGVLKTEHEIRYAKYCQALVRSFAKVGIIALVDEATGYQEVRDKNELHKILDAFVAKELLPWAKRFPDEFYKELFRLMGWKYSPFTVKRPKYVGILTNELVYSRLPLSVKDEIRKKNPVVNQDTWRRKTTHHQHLTHDVGIPYLNKLLSGITALMRASTNWREFKRLFERAYPKANVSQYELPVETNFDIVEKM